MAVRVLIEREIDPASELKLKQVLMDMRYKAMKAKGYISGETLRALNNPNSYLVISNWETVEDWKAWVNSSDRKQLADELNQHMRNPEKIAVYIHI
jgi:heme-degrading monooxygenase HmoA